MCRLILSEFKKIWKSKTNILLVLFLAGISIFFSINNYDIDGVAYDTDVIFDGEKLSNADLRKRIDQDAKAFEGLIDTTKYETIFKEYQTKMEQTKQNDQMDVAKMERMFGKDYQTYVQKVQNQTMSEEEYFQKYCEFGCSYDQDTNGKLIFPIFYVNDGQRSYYNMLYANSYDTKLFNNKDELSSSPFYILSHKASFLYPEGENYSYIFSDDDTNKDQKIINTYLSEKIEKQDNIYSSTIANNIFMDNLNSCLNVFTLLVIAILTANIFANEVRYKTDQILVPTTLGSRFLVPAKC